MTGWRSATNFCVKAKNGIWVKAISFSSNKKSNQSWVTWNGSTKNRKEWESLNTWLLESAELFYRVFSPRVKKLVLD